MEVLTFQSVLCSKFTVCSLLGSMLAFSHQVTIIIIRAYNSYISYLKESLKLSQCKFVIALFTQWTQDVGPDRYRYNAQSLVKTLSGNHNQAMMVLVGCRLVGFRRRVTPPSWIFELMLMETGSFSVISKLPLTSSVQIVNRLAEHIPGKSLK